MALSRSSVAGDVLGPTLASAAARYPDSQESGQVRPDRAVPSPDFPAVAPLLPPSGGIGSNHGARVIGAPAASATSDRKAKQAMVRASTTVRPKADVAPRPSTGRHPVLLPPGQPTMQSALGHPRAPGSLRLSPEKWRCRPAFVLLS